tara:strand:- start:183 stop:1280 length:1098 start_codon:yes stop_codon:yes gene_type:complete
MSKARQLADNGAATPNRNMVINGAMNIAQRSTSVAALGATSGYYTLDRWHLSFVGTAGRLDMTQTADGPAGFENCLKLECKTADTSIAATEYVSLNTYFESQNCVRIGSGTSAAKEVTVSFYVKGNASATYVVQLLNNNHSSYIHNNRTFAVTTAWVRHEITFQADTTADSAFDTGNLAGIALLFIMHAGSNYKSATLASDWATGVTNRATGTDSFFDSTDRTFFLTGVQFEVGPSATPFEHKTFAQDLQECQRYFRRLPTDEDATAYARIGNGMLYDSSSAFITIPLSPPMRTSAAASINGTLKIQVAANADCTVTGVAAVAANNSRTAFYADFTCDANGTAGHGCGLNRENDADASLDLEAEL